MTNQHTIGDTVTFKTSVQNWDTLNKRWVQFEYGQASGTVYAVKHSGVEVMANYGIFRISNRDLISGL